MPLASLVTFAPLQFFRNVTYCRAAAYLGALSITVVSASSTACTLTPLRKTEVLDEKPGYSGTRTWLDILEAPLEIEIKTEVTARWKAKRKGLVNLKHQKAIVAGLKSDEQPIVVLVHVIRHPVEGDFVIDTGIDHGMTSKEGKSLGVKGLSRWFIRDMEPEISLQEIIERDGLELSGVFLTHAHLDHVLGLPDVPNGVPVYTGPRELKARRFGNGLMFRSYHSLFRKDMKVLEFDPANAVDIEGIPAIDVFGDNSIWALLVPGHTRGSVAYLVNAAGNQTLFVGDTSHTLWGWENGVEPGTFSADQEANAASLRKLKRLVGRYAQVWPIMGHEVRTSAAESDSDVAEDDSAEDELDTNEEGLLILEDEL